MGRSDRLYDVGMLVLRLGFGLGLVYFHGWGKLTGGPEAWARTGGAMETLGIGFGHTFFGFLAAFAEAVGGLMIAAGLFFRVAALLVAGTMAVAWWMHVSTGQGNPAHAFKNIWVALGLGFLSPGAFSVDAWWARRDWTPEIEIPEG